MYRLQNTLYVMTQPSYLRLDNGTVRVEVEQEKRLQVPLHHLGAIVCFGNVLVSPALMHVLAEAGKSLVLLDEHGRFKARLEGGVSGNVLLRLAQFSAASSAEQTLELARSCIAGKLRNGRTVILRAARESDSEAERLELQRQADALAASLRAAAVVHDLDELRGIEGEAARVYFAALNLAVKPAQRERFRLDGRSRRPPRDRFNALLSFLYVLSMNDCRSALETVGLDPQIGFLHAVRPGRAALALDLQEEFRSPLCDRLALTLINRGQLSSDDFIERDGGSIFLTDKARRTVVLAWQERKKEEITHPLLEQKMPLGLVPLVQARLLARAVRGEDERYLPWMAR